MLLNQYSKLEKKFVEKNKKKTKIKKKAKPFVIKQEYAMWNTQRSPKNGKKNIENEYDIISLFKQ